MINTIAHAGDIHIPKLTERHPEFRKVFKQFYDKLKELKPDRIVIGGDIYDNFIDIEGEPLVLMGEFLNNLSLIAPTRIIKGNHDYRKRNINRIDTVMTATAIMDNPNIIYYDKSGFYEDDNVVWVVWDHADKINPWTAFPTKKNKEKIYIDIFHDPIDGCKFFNEYTPINKKYRKVSDLKGQLSLLNDIHLHQSFSNGTKAYSGSLLQLNFGESVDNHGFLLWDLNTMSFKKFDLKNEHAFIKFVINPGQDYDKLKLNSKHITKYNKFRVEWNDYAANVTNENENKIRKYLKDKYEATDIEIKANRIYTDIKEGKMLSEIIDINDKNVQQDIIKKYLKENKFDDDFILKIIDIDDTINDRVDSNVSKNIIWNIDKLWFSNFKSYGDDNVIDWSKDSGIINIAGENQQGKTTILDAICFILYGTTLSTTKTEKNGNSRYINKYRDLNYCEGGCIIDINGEKYIMQRRVDKEIKKGIVKSCPMILDLYKGSEIVEENKLTGERKTSTQKILDNVLGNFDDFIRMSLTNADNLNSLLSMDRSVFIDSIVKDAGYDIFEKKLEEFKEYKKELNLDKINLNENDIESQINNMSSDLKDKEDLLSNINEEIKNIEDKISEKITEKEDCLRKLHKIDDKIVDLDIDEIKKEIKESEKKRKEIQIQIDELNVKMSPLPKNFDIANLDKITEQYDKYVTEKNKRDIEIVQLKNIYRQNEEKIENVDRDINIEKTKYFDFLRNNIASFRIELREIINEINNNSNNKRIELETLKNSYKNEINNLKQFGIEEKKKISDYTDILNGENKVCITCNQPILNKDDEHMNTLILESTKKVEDITKNGKKKIELYNECNTNLESLKEITDNLIEEKKLEYEIKIKSVQDKIDNFTVALIQDRIEEVIKNKENAEIYNESLSVKIEEREKYIQRLVEEIKKLSTNINTLKSNKVLYEEYKNLNQNKFLLESDIKDYKKTSEDNNRLIEEYNKNKTLILENEKNNSKLEKIKEEIDILTPKRTELIDNKLSYSNEITLLRKVIGDLKTKLDTYREQKLIEELHAVYLKLMHRTGLPTYLLTKNIDLLNKELSSLLTNTDFILFFDEDLNLKLQHNGKEGEINAIETSGMERTFSAIVLKIVLRIINFKSKPNFMFMDEVLNRLVNKSVNKFMELLETLKTKIDKIIVIEHNNEIYSDLVINVTKDEKGISKFEIV